MVIARAQALSLLTDPEMVLFGDSRNPALRSFDERELTRRIDRVRKLRDKSRDLLQRQRLSSRDRTGNKGGKSGAANERTARKAEVLDDVLQRFENRLHELERSGPPGAGTKSRAAARKGAAATAKAKKAPQRGAAKKTAGVAKKTTAATTKSTGAAKKAAGKAKKAGGSAGPAEASPPTRSAAAKSAATKKATKSAAAPASSKPRRSAVTAEQALASTHELLEALQQRHKGPRGRPGDGDAGQPGPGYQSAQAKNKALELHAAEVRMEPIHGSISTRDRKNQAKRDRS